MRTRHIVAIILSSAVLLLAAGCGTARLWGAKSGGSPARLGGDISIPLDKK